MRVVTCAVVKKPGTWVPGSYPVTHYGVKVYEAKVRKKDGKWVWSLLSTKIPQLGSDLYEHVKGLAMKKANDEGIPFRESVRHNEVVADQPSKGRFKRLSEPDLV